MFSLGPPGRRVAATAHRGAARGQRRCTRDGDDRGHRDGPDRRQRGDHTSAHRAARTWASCWSSTTSGPDSPHCRTCSRASSTWSRSTVRSSAPSTSTAPTVPSSRRSWPLPRPSTSMSWPRRSESKVQADALRGLGCRWAQGYLYDRPLAPEGARGSADGPARAAVRHGHRRHPEWYAGAAGRSHRRHAVRLSGVTAATHRTSRQAPISPILPPA